MKDYLFSNNPLENLDEFTDFTEKDRTSARSRIERKEKEKAKAKENVMILHSKCSKAQDDAIRKYISNLSFRTNLDEAREALKKVKNLTREAYI